MSVSNLSLIRMSSRRTDEAHLLTSALNATSVALGVAREATDAVPIVKQVLGAALRIVGQAEKMENDREALRALADSSLQLARQVRDVMEGKTADSTIQASLERVLGVLDSIETFMKKHAAHSRLRRAVRYAFTVHQHVKRLSGELGDAVRDLLVVSLLATHAAVQDSARFEGKFRLLRDCEVDKLEPIGQLPMGENVIVRYHRAQIDGELRVVRYFEGSILQQSPLAQTFEETMLNSIASHDSILEEISSVQRSHLNFARIYGWSRGSVGNRFIVFKSGYQPFDHRLFGEFADPLITCIHWTLKDAVDHLQSLGILWMPYYPPYAIDDQLQPVIGLQNDLRRMGPDTDQLRLAHEQIYIMSLPVSPISERQNVPVAEMCKHIAGCSAERLTNLFGGVETTQRDRHIFPKAELCNRHILTDTAREGLLRILEHGSANVWWHDQSWMWANILLVSDQNRSDPLVSSLGGVYFACSSGRDHIYLYGIGQDQERIVYDTYTFYFTGEQRYELRDMFGISAPSQEELFTGRVIARGTYCTLSD